MVHKLYEPGHEQTCLMSYANNKGTDQPVHPCSLIRAFVVRCLDSVMSLVSVTKISSLMLASVAEQASLSLTWLETPEDTFSHGVAQLYFHIFRAFVDQTAATMHLPAKIGKKTKNIFTVDYPVSLYANKCRARIVYTP